MTMNAMNKAEIIAELENMVATRLFSGQPWLADRETLSAIHGKLVEMGLVEQFRAEPLTWRYTPLGKEVDVQLFEVFIGLIYEWDVPIILKQYGLLDESEFDAICGCTCGDAICGCTSEADAESLLGPYVKRAYFDYRKASRFLH